MIDRSKIISTVVAMGFPIALFLYSYFSSPGYWQPFMRQPFGVPILIGALVWLGIGTAVLLLGNGWIRKLGFVVFSVPVSLLSMLGPAILTIIQALGPISSAK